MRFQMSENQIINTITAAEYSLKMDCFFEDIYRENIESYLPHFRYLVGFELIEETINNTPLRKFKSAIPFLAGRKDARIIPYACLSEIVFAMWTIVDNLLDERQEKYGKETTYKIYKHGYHIAPIYSWIADLETLVSKIIDIDFAKGLTQYLLKQARSQYLLSKFDYKMLESTYYTVVRDRSIFLGYIWSSALAKIEMPKESRYIRAYQWRSAVFGQVLNDYFDSIKSEPDDSEMFRMSLSWILIRESENDQFQSYVSACRKAKSRIDKIEIYKQLLNKYDIIQKLRKRVKHRGGRLYNFIDNYMSANQITTLLRAWQLMSEKDVSILSPLKETESIGFFKDEIEKFKNQFLST